MIILMTDYGMLDPYVGLLKSRLAEFAPSHLVIDLLHDVPAFNAHSGAHLLAAFANGFPLGSVFLSVVDPGVGTERNAVVMLADGRWFIGPDNGLLSVMSVRSADTRQWRINWQPEVLSTTFHGRDLFAIIAAEIATGHFPHDKLVAVEKLNVEFDAGDLPRIVYIDHFGNAWTGVRNVPGNSRVSTAGVTFKHSSCFGFVGKGEGFWFINSVGLLELAVNRGSASSTYRLKVGDPVLVERPN